MRRIIHTLPLLVILLASLPSCLDGERKEQRTQADSLLMLWEETRAEFSTIDTIAVSETWHEFESLLDSFNRYYTDAYQDTTWEVIRLYAEVKGPLKYVIRNRAGIRDAIAYSGKQIRSLRRDIARGRLSAEEASSYLNTEREELFRLGTEVGMLKENASLGLAWFAERSGPLTEAIEYMKSHATP